MSDEAVAFLRARRRPLELVIFDCDGVLIDSEALCNRVVADILTAEGWAMSAEECEHRFVGMSFYSMQPEIEARLGRVSFSRQGIARRPRSCTANPAFSLVMTPDYTLVWVRK